jgi:hypothetical protein
VVDAPRRSPRSPATTDICIASAAIRHGPAVPFCATWRPRRRSRRYRPAVQAAPVHCFRPATARAPRLGTCPPTTGGRIAAPPDPPAPLLATGSRGRRRRRTGRQRAWAKPGRMPAPVTSAVPTP